MIGLISDIHANLHALEAVIDALEKKNVTRIYCLGDIAGYGNLINETCELLINKNVKCIMGNHDWYLAGGAPCKRSSLVNFCIDYQLKVITKSNIEWIRSFPVTRLVDELSMVHGGWVDPIDEYLLDLSSEYFLDIRGKFFASGHTHKQVIYQIGDGRVYCNPGAVGQPRDGDLRAAFATFFDSEFELHRVEYNASKTVNSMKRAGFPENLYNRLV